MDAGAQAVLTADEIHLLDNYRRLRRQAQGFLFIEFVRGAVTKYEVKDGGDAPLMNELVQRLRPPPPE